MNALALALAFLAVQMPDGQDAVRVAAQLTPDSARIGQRVTLTLTVSEVPAGAEVVFPELPDTGAVSALAPPARLTGAPAAGVWRARYELAAWSLGELQLPAAEVRVLADESEQRIPIPQLTLQVISVLPAAGLDTLTWKPPAGVVGANWSLQEKLAGAALALALLSAAAAYLRRRSAARPVPVPEARPPRERALAAIAALEENGMVEAGEFKAFYSALSQIVRTFLAEADPNWGLDLTTLELVSAVSRDGVKPAELAALSALLGGADMAKFARWRPNAADAKRALAEARRWLEQFERVMPAPPTREVEGVEGGEPEATSEEELAELERIFDVADADDEAAPSGGAP